MVSRGKTLTRAQAHPRIRIYFGQVYKMVGGRIKAKIGIYGRLGCFLDMLRCLEVRFADTQVDYIHSSSTQFGTLLGHRQSLRLGKRLHQQRRFLLHKSMYYIVLVIVISSYGLSWENTHACAGTPAHTHILRTKVQNLCLTHKSLYIHA